MTGTRAAATRTTPLAAEDAEILALESGTIRGHILKVVLVQDAPGPSAVPELAARISAGLAQAPRWRQRLVPDPANPAGLCWQDDPAFRIDRHVRATAAGEPVDGQALREIVAESMMTPLDRDKPLWTLDVVPRLTDGRWALIWKAHHCLADGMAMVRAGSLFIWAQQTPGPGAGGHEAPSGRSGAQEPAGRPKPAGARRQLRAGARLAKIASHRGLLIREFRRMGPLSPLAADVGPDRRVAFAGCPLSQLRAIGKALTPPATINDVLLAVVAGALRRWLAGQGLPLPAMKAQVPVSLHPDPGAVEPEGNRDSFLFVTLPVGEADPVARVQAVSAATRRRKNRHDAQAIYSLRRSLARVPDAVRQPLERIAQGPHRYSLNVSNVPGPASPIYVLGRQADELYALAELAPRHALRVAAISLAGTLFTGLNADPAVLPDVEAVATGIDDAVRELRERLAGRRVRS